MRHRSFLLGACVAALCATAATACDTTSSSSTDTTPGSDGGGTASDAGDAAAARPDAGGSTTNDGGNDAPTSGGACGITLQGSKWAAACQSWLDQNCCAEQQACAGDPECKALYDCANACPSPPQDSCLNACGSDASAATLDRFSAIGDCSKRAPADGGAAIPHGCAWP